MPDNIQHSKRVDNFYPSTIYIFYWLICVARIPYHLLCIQYFCVSVVFLDAGSSGIGIRQLNNLILTCIGKIGKVTETVRYARNCMHN